MSKPTLAGHHGPTRIILINAGKYGYAEIDLDGAVHLVGPNNAGKTSLISTLLFLYIDSPTNGDFTESFYDTKRYYFPTPDCYILFEVLKSAGGYQMVGLHGLGAANGYDIQRFTYEGRFSREDFIAADGKTVLPPEEVKLALSDRSYTPLAADSLRAALLGTADKGVNLGIVPLKDRGSYRNFREAFKNLLRLSHLTQDELKKFLKLMYNQNIVVDEISLYDEGVADQLNRVKRHSKEVNDLRQISDDAARALELGKQRSQKRSSLLAIWPLLNAARDAEIGRLSATRSSLDAETAEIDGKKAGLISSIEAEGRKASDMERKIGEFSGEIKRIHSVGKEFESFMPELERGRLGSLQVEVEQLAAQLSGPAIDSVEALEKRIRSRQDEHDRLQLRLQNFSKRIEPKLREMLGDESVSNLFTIFNKEILGMPVGDGGVVINDPDKLVELARQIAGRIDAGQYQDDTISIQLRSLDRPRLGEDPESLARDLRQIASEINLLKGQLEVAKNRNEIESRKKSKDKEWQDLLAKLTRYDSWQTDLQRIAEIERENQLLESELGRQRLRIRALDDDRLRLTTRANEIVRLRSECETQLRGVMGLRPFPPSAEWDESPSTDTFPHTITDLLETYQRLLKDEVGLSERIHDLLVGIERRTAGRYSAAMEIESFKRLADEIDGLEEKQKQVDEAWTGLVTGLRSRCKGILDSLEAINAGISDINRQLKRVPVSDIQQLSLRMERTSSMVKKLEALRDTQAMPLFSDEGESQQAMKGIEEMLRDAHKIDLTDLFSLSFEVVGADGRVRKFTDNAKIESNGTTVTIKVLVNLMLLRALLRPGAWKVPFYLDEVGLLDEKNLEAIVSEAMQLGFVPVLASPQPRLTAHSIYFIEDRGGRSYVEPARSKVRLVKQETADVA